MLLTAVFALASTGPVELYRQFTPGQTLAYEVRSHILAEQKFEGMQFYLPSEFSMDYEFALDIKKLGHDGFAEVEYRRPVVRLTEGQTEDSPPKTTTEKVDWHVAMTLSPVNEVTGLKDLKKPGGSGGGRILATAALGAPAQDFVSSMIEQLHGLAMFAGNLDSSLDLSPKLPFEEVLPGAKWKRTVGYQPRLLAGSDQHAMQRLDYEFEYKGRVQGAGGEVERIVGSLHLETDASKFINQSLGMTAAESGLSKLELRLDASVVYDLDPKTLDTVRVEAGSKGGFSIHVTGRRDPVVVEKFTGTASMRLVSRK